MVRMEDWVNISSDLAERVLRLGCDLREGITDEYDYETYLLLVSTAFNTCGDDVEILLDVIGEWE